MRRQSQDAFYSNETREIKSWITDQGVYLHVDPKGPDVQGVDGLPEPVRQVHAIKTAPGPREQASGEGAVQRHLQEQTQTCTLIRDNLGLGIQYMKIFIFSCGIYAMIALFIADCIFME